MGMLKVFYAAIGSNKGEKKMNQKWMQVGT